MAVPPAVLAMRVPVGRVGAFNFSPSGEESNRGTHCEYISRVDGNDDRGGSLALPRLCIGVEISRGVDAYVFRVEDRLREARDKFLRILREEGDLDGVDCALCLVRGEAEGQEGTTSHVERVVELAGKGVEVQCKGRGWGGRVGDEKGD